MPTGIALPDARERLFGAAERVLLRDGPGGLTSRAVTDEAGVAKGVLHRHFADFDDFLAGLVLDRATRLELTTAALLGAAGTGTVAGNLADALTAAFGPVAVGMVALITVRDALRARLRETWPVGMPLLTEIARMVDAYLHAEIAAGRVAADADASVLARILIGAAHLLFADRTAPPPGPDAVESTVAAVLAPALR